MPAEYYLGIMSGTSLDAVDAVLAEFAPSARIIASYQHPFPAELRRCIQDLAAGMALPLMAVGELDQRLGHLFADAALALLEQEGLSASAVRAIGSHGQTVFHQPAGEYPFTLQLGDAHLIAARSGIDTVADFRRKDMALGGQGAPLVPAFHEYLFSSQKGIRIVLNIGGIANISVLSPGCDTLGYDTGPGNMLMDAWAERHSGRPYDADAALARQGQVQAELLARLLADDYFALPPPKSTGRERFHLPWLEAQLAALPAYSAANVQRSLLEFSAQSIARAIRSHAAADLMQEVIVCGGGARNPLLMQRLGELLPQWRLASSDTHGIDADYLEAAAFAWLAYCHLHEIPANLPAVTGAARKTLLGALHRAQ